MNLKNNKFQLPSQIERRVAEKISIDMEWNKKEVGWSQYNYRRWDKAIYDKDIE